MKKALIIVAAIYAAGFAYFAWKRGRLDVWAWPLLLLNFAPAAAASQPAPSTVTDTVAAANKAAADKAAADAKDAAEKAAADAKAANEPKRPARP